MGCGSSAPAMLAGNSRDAFPKHSAVLKLSSSREEAADSPVTKKPPPPPALKSSSLRKLKSGRSVIGRGGQGNVMSWSPPRVAAWLRLLGLGKYVHSFLENGVDGALLMKLKRDQIENCLGIKNPMHQHSLEAGILDLKQKVIDYDNWEWSADRVLDWLHAKGLGMLAPVFSVRAIHGGVLFRASSDMIENVLAKGMDSKLIAMSLAMGIKRAKSISLGKCSDDDGSVASWGPAEVRKWLHANHMGHLETMFAYHAIHGYILLKLNADILEKRMGCTELQTIVILRSIKELKKVEKKGKSAAAELLDEHEVSPPSSFSLGSCSSFSNLTVDVAEQRMRTPSPAPPEASFMPVSAAAAAAAFDKPVTSSRWIRPTPIERTERHNSGGSTLRRSDSGGFSRSTVIPHGDGGGSLKYLKRSSTFKERRAEARRAKAKRTTSLRSFSPRIEGKAVDESMREVRRKVREARRNARANARRVARADRLAARAAQLSAESQN